MYACLSQPLNVIGQLNLRCVWLGVDLRTYINEGNVWFKEIGLSSKFSSDLIIMGLIVKVTTKGGPI